MASGRETALLARYPPGKLFRYNPATGHHEQCFDLNGESIGGFTVQADGALLLFMAKGAVKIWRNGQFETVLEDIPNERETDGSIHQILDGIGCSNGMGFTPDRKKMYYTDSGARTIYLFDYDENSGAITNQQVFLKTPQDEGIPDGMTVDAEGYIWTSKWDGYALVRYAPNGTEDRRITFDTKKVSCVTFAGNNYTDMYVTTAGGHDKVENGDDAGALFRLNLNIKGVPEFRSRVGL